MSSSNLSNEPCVLRGAIVQLPKAAIVQEHVFRNIFSDNTWKNVLDEESRHKLRKLLPGKSPKEQDTAVHKLFTFQNIKFGNPLKRFQKGLKRNQYNPENYYYRLLKKRALHRAYKQRMLVHKTHTLENLILLRQQYMTDIQGLTEADIHNKTNTEWREKARSCLHIPNKSLVDVKARALYKKVTSSVRNYCNDDYSSSSDDEQDDKSTVTTSAPEMDMKSALISHRKRRIAREIAPSLDTRGVAIADIIDRVYNNKRDSEDENEKGASAPPPANKKAKVRTMSTQSEKKLKPVKQEPTTSHTTATNRSAMMVPYQNVLGLLKIIMTSNSLYREMSSTEIGKRLNDWQESQVARLCPWTTAIHDWAAHITDILSVLSDSDGPQLVTQTPTGEWKWAGEGRDSKQQLQAEWNRILEACPSLALIMGDASLPESSANKVSSAAAIDTDDQPPEAKHGDDFISQEALRFAHPHKCFTYKLDGKEYLVGPVKGVYEKISHTSNNKAREHALLINDRPSYVTILTLGK